MKIAVKAEVFPVRKQGKPKCLPIHGSTVYNDMDDNVKGYDDDMDDNVKDVFDNDMWYGAPHINKNIFLVWSTHSLTAKSNVDFI